MPLLSGTDGRKMSKSGGNSIGIAEAADTQFAKVMSLPDHTVDEWIGSLAPGLDAPRGVDARRRRLAAAIVTEYHSSAVERDAEAKYDATQRGPVGS